MKGFLIFLLVAAGLFLIGATLWPNAYPAAVAALKKRSPKQITQSEVLLSKLATKIAPHIEIDPIKRIALSDELQSLSYTVTPEMFRAKALAQALVFSSVMLWTVLISPFIGLIIWGFTLWAFYSGAEKKLHKEIEQRRNNIERELPQFSGTIRQSLNSTHDVIAIMESYRKVCGSALKEEIERTLNEMRTGNPERALKSFESRVASTKLSELTRGLVGVMRGDDRRVYFDMLTMQYQKAANEAVTKALLLRPQKLYPYMGVLFGCLVLMIGVALGLYMIKQFGVMF